MNISVNSIGFSGKNEILYGLKKASMRAQSLELCEKAYCTSRMAMTKYEERIAYSASIRAYLDMVINDAEYIGTVAELNKTDLKGIKDILKEECTEHGTIRPFNIIRNNLIDIIKSQKHNKETANSTVKLINMLA